MGASSQVDSQGQYLSFQAQERQKDREHQLDLQSQQFRHDLLMNAIWNRMSGMDSQMLDRCRHFGAAMSRCGVIILRRLRGIPPGTRIS